MAAVLGLPQHRIRVIGPDVGGGFGVKDHIYEDELMVCLAALELGRPVKWVEDRRESLTVTAQARGARAGRRGGLRPRRDAAGPSHLRRARRRSQPVDLRRRPACQPGGQPARALPVGGGARHRAGRGDEQRCRRGRTAGSASPRPRWSASGPSTWWPTSSAWTPSSCGAGTCSAPMTCRSRRERSLTYENGDYPANLARAAELTEAGPPPPADGRSRGVGFSSYVELAGVGPTSTNKVLGVRVGTYETATVRMATDSSVSVITGSSPHGQGHETSFAQLAADRLGVPLERISLIHSDTDVTPYSPYGTAASRSITVGGGALVLAAEELADKIRRIAAQLLEAAPGRHRPGRGARRRRRHQRRRLPDRGGGTGVAGLRPAGRDDAPAWSPPGATIPRTSRSPTAPTPARWRSTGPRAWSRSSASSSCTTAAPSSTPLIVEGQVHGGVAQGLGAALLEEVVFADDGQPLTRDLPRLPPADLVDHARRRDRAQRDTRRPTSPAA